MLATRPELTRFPRMAPLGAARPQKRGGEEPTGRNGRGMRGSPGRRRGAAHSTWEVARCLGIPSKQVRYPMAAPRTRQTR